MTAVALMDMQQLKDALMRRMAYGEIELRRLLDYVKTGEGLQDRINEQVAARLKALEDKTSSL